MATVPADYPSVVDEPFIAPSAYRHGVSEEVIIHAFEHPIRVEELDESLTMLVGPDRAGNLYEIGSPTPTTVR